MTIEQRLKKLAQIFNEAHHLSENQIYISKQTLLSKGVDREDLEYGLGYFQREGVITRERDRSSHEIYSPPKNPFDWFRLVISNLPLDMYVFTIDREKLNAFFGNGHVDSNAKKARAEFVDEKAVLKFGETLIRLPPYKNEHYFCRVAFEYQPNEPIDWSIIFEKMTGSSKEFFGEPEATKKNWQKVYDTVKSLNKRLAQKGLNRLFVWQDKTIRRMQ